MNIFVREPILYRFLRPMFVFVFKTIYRPTIVGASNIPTSDSVVLAGNHTHDLDAILLISSTKRTIHFLGKHTLLQGFKKILFGNVGIIPVDRTRETNADVLEQAIKTLKNDRVIGIFPEATINRTKVDVTLPFKTGAVRMAKESGAVVVPFVISGEYKKFKKRLQIEFYEPYRITGEVEEETGMLQSIIAKGIIEKQEEK